MRISDETREMVLKAWAQRDTAMPEEEAAVALAESLGVTVGTLKGVVRKGQVETKRVEARKCEVRTCPMNRGGSKHYHRRNGYGAAKKKTKRAADHPLVAINHDVKAIAKVKRDWRRRNGAVPNPLAPLPVVDVVHAFEQGLVTVEDGKARLSATGVRTLLVLRSFESESGEGERGA